jgi:hypothetical protein
MDACIEKLNERVASNLEKQIILFLFDAPSSVLGILEVKGTVQRDGSGRN